MIHLDWTFARPGCLCAARGVINLISALLGHCQTRTLCGLLGIIFSYGLSIISVY